MVATEDSPDFSQGAEELMRAGTSARLAGLLLTGALALSGTVLSPPAEAAPAVENQPSTR